MIKLSGKSGTVLIDFAKNEAVNQPVWCQLTT